MPDKLKELSADDLAVAAKTDEQAFEYLAKRYRQYTYSVIRRIIGRQFIDEHDDLSSIGLIALYEAVQKYDAEKGQFLSFAASVIKNRVIDNERRTRHFPQTMPLDDDNEDEDQVSYSAVDKASIAAYDRASIAEKRRYEIEALGRELAKWDLTFSDLAEDSPKHGGTRDFGVSVLEGVMKNEEIVRRILEGKLFPIKQIEIFLKVHRKKLERLRTYIIAGVIILSGDYPMLREYLDIHVSNSTEGGSAL